MGSADRCAALFTCRVRTPRYSVGALVLMLLGGTSHAVAQSTNGTAPGVVRAYTTIYSIGIEWDIAGDADHDATAAVEFRTSGSSTWLPVLPLLRVDGNSSNMMAGSILFLSPSTTYDVRLTLSDPDGGAETRVIALPTRPVPALPASGRNFHVVPGSGGGDGSSANPFRGIAAAQAIAVGPGTFRFSNDGDQGVEASVECSTR